VAARRCTTCARNWPETEAQDFCPQCGSALWWTDDAPIATLTEEEEMDASLGFEESELWRYRVRRFRELGFTRPQRVRLANEAADWHEAHDMLGAGCPVDVVFDILSL
jgi:hypothetical protein